MTKPNVDHAMATLCMEWGFKAQERGLNFDAAYQEFRELLTEDNRDLGEQGLEDELSECISDTHDIDINDRDYAKACVKKLRELKIIP